jgi:hypothetical protein
LIVASVCSHGREFFADCRGVILTSFPRCLEVEAQIAEGESGKTPSEKIIGLQGFHIRHQIKKGGRR